MRTLIVLLAICAMLQCSHHEKENIQLKKQLKECNDSRSIDTSDIPKSSSARRVNGRLEWN
jgi:hypothetical protein